MRATKRAWLWADRSRWRTLLAVGTVVLWIGFATVASAGLYNFTVDDGAGDKGFGTLSTTSTNGWGDDSLLSLSGTLHVTATQNAGILPLGAYSLIPTPGGVVTENGVNGFFVDSLAYPANDAWSGANNGGLSSNPSYLTNDGLKFGTNGTFEINIWGNGNNDYALYTATSNGAGGANYGITTGSGGVFTLAQAPEPSSLILACVVGTLAVGCGVRLRRKA